MAGSPPGRFSVGELIEALDDPGDDAPVYVSFDPQGGQGAARQLEVETGKPVETVVIYPV